MKHNYCFVLSMRGVISMKNENNVELVSPIGETCKRVDLRKAMVPICDEKLSPFASYVGDTHKLNKPKKNTTKVEADFLLEKGHIGEIEKAILFTINRLVFATSLQITYYLKKSGYQIESKTVARKLTRLKEKSFVRQIEFVSENSISSYKAYYLGYHGTGLLRALDVKTYSQGYVSEIKTFKIKSILASNQLLTQVMNDDLEFEVSKVIVNDNIRGCIVRPQSILKFKDHTFLVEVVRKTPDWQEKLNQKLSRYDVVLENYQNLNVEFKTKPKLIIQGESYEHMFEIMKLYEENNYEHIDIIFTFDRILLYQLENAFFVISKDTHKKGILSFLFRGRKK